MILVDTSVWIDFLRGDPATSQTLASELDAGNVLALECVFGELLQGARDDRERGIIRGYWDNLPKIEDAGLWLAAGEYAGRQRLLSQGVGLIDALILVAARAAHAAVWTRDRKLFALMEPGERYRPHR